MPEEKKAPIRRLAVVAVHGVGYHEPGATARDVANLLLTQPESAIRYGPFEATDITIATRPVVVPVETATPPNRSPPVARFEADPGIAAGERDKATAPPPDAGLFEERSEFVLNLHAVRPPAQDQESADVAASEEITNVATADNDGYALGFMRDQLRRKFSAEGDTVCKTERLNAAPRQAQEPDVESQVGEQPSGRPSAEGNTVYETQRLSAIRRHAEKPDVELHVYEMYWSDLSRIGTWVGRILAELYQFLLHLGSLGRLTADFALAEHRGDSSRRSWACFDCWVRMSVRLFTLPIPILNLLLLAVVFMPIPGQLLGVRGAPLAAPILLGLLAAVLVVRLLLLQLRPPWPVWLLAPPLVAVGGVLIGKWLISGDAQGVGLLSCFQLLAFEWCVVAAAILCWVMRLYNRLRPGAKLIGWITGGILAVLTIVQLLHARGSNTAIFTAALKLVELLVLGLFACWLVLLACEWLAFIAGCRALCATRRFKPEVKDRAKRAVHTAWLALSLPNVLFLIITLVLFRAMNRAAVAVFPCDLPLYHPCWLLRELAHFPEQLSAVDFHDKLIVATATPAFLIVLFALAATVIMAVWGLLPVVLYDLVPPAKNSDALSQTLGNWLNYGYRLLAIAGFIVYFAFLFVLSGGLLAEFLGIPVPLLSAGATPQALALLAAGVLGSAGGLLAFNGRMEKMALGFRTALNTILDVDCWLREHPRGDNPRARICARYVSLLRHIWAWRDTRDDGRYDGVIIVAHSQGTVISAELLRFLHKYPDPELDRLDEGGVPLALFTLGCPLRQLYGWRFPHLYAWARHTGTTPWIRDTPRFIPANQLPDPTQLGVQQWVNAFRSGDYVGRYLWRSDACDYQWDWSDKGLTVSEDQAGLRREFCIGAGGHIHYFDSTAPQVAAELNRLISEIGKVTNYAAGARDQPQLG